MPRQDIMLAKKITPKLLDRISPFCFVQPKLNGLRCRAMKSLDGKIRLFSSQANIFVSVPHINEALENIPGSSFHLDGELYIHGMKFQDICSLVKRDTALPDSKNIEYHIYDYINLQTFAVRYFKLNQMVAPHLYLSSTTSAAGFSIYYEPVKIVETVRILTKDWEKYCERFVQQGFEGIILRNKNGLYETKRSSNLLKFKPKKIGLFKILTEFEAVDKYGDFKNTLGGFILKTQTCETFSCGCGNLTHAERQKIWDSIPNNLKLEEHLAEVEYPELTKRGVPHQPILKRLVQNK